MLGLFVDHLGFCHARWSLLVHCDRCTPRRAPPSPRVLQEVRWLGGHSQRAPPWSPDPIIPGCWYLPHLSVAPPPLEKWSTRARIGAPDHGAGCASTRSHRMGISFRACIGSLCLRCGHLLPPSLHDQVLSFILRSGPLIDLKNKTQGGVDCDKGALEFYKDQEPNMAGTPMGKKF